MLLLLFNPSVQGALRWSGPDPSRSLFVPIEVRSFVVAREQRVFIAV